MKIKIPVVIPITICFVYIVSVSIMKADESQNNKDAKSLRSGLKKA